jgi:hypothetical protein
MTPVTYIVYDTGIKSDCTAISGSVAVAASAWLTPAMQQIGHSGENRNA